MVPSPSRSTIRARLLNTLLKHVLQVVVIIDIRIQKAIEFNDFCHNHKPPIAFITSAVRGLFGNIFCDFGDGFTVDDDGENQHTGIISNISMDNRTLVNCLGDEKLEFQDGDLVVGGGIVTRVTGPKVFNFKPLRIAIKESNNFLVSDRYKSDRPLFIRAAFSALERFLKNGGRFPGASSEEDANELNRLLPDKLCCVTLDEIQAELLRKFSFGAKAVLSPMATMFGAIVGQEVVKACSQKLHLLFQFFYFDSAESLPSDSLDSNDL
ncbi:ubiquitin-activating enzyme e1 2 [Phtheirospermum japonicum]|uniref:Ubiquitin-activating enzyme e1 2 n=1 Tax=Phtheirospermum japonicum TaxID=374723 RepID=A0A830DAZ1_9LAMI|nr:ubiquitin-activating enzyme e1 2 [Phtheirospermum japonicum]